MTGRQRQWLMAWLLTALLVIPPIGVLGQNDNDEDDPLPALQKRVATLETQVAALQTQVASTGASTTSVPTDIPALSDPSSTPVTLAPGMDLLYYYIVPTEYGAAILGELQNTADHDVGTPSLQFTLLDAEGNIVDVIEQLPLYFYAAPGDRVPFQIDVDLPPDAWSAQEVALCEGYGFLNSYNGVPDASSGFVFEDVQEIEKEPGHLYLEGKVRNNRDAPAEDVKIEVAIYGADGRFAGYGRHFRMDVPIPVGKTAPFELYADDPPGIQDTTDYSYVLWAGTAKDLTIGFC